MVVHGTGVPIITKPRPPHTLYLRIPFANQTNMLRNITFWNILISDYFSIIVWKRLLFVFEKVSVGVFVSRDAELLRVSNTNLKGSLHFGQLQPFFCVFKGILTAGCLILAFQFTRIS